VVKVVSSVRRRANPNAGARRQWPAYPRGL
jgi:hypothetical protein